MYHWCLSGVNNVTQTACLKKVQQQLLFLQLCCLCSRWDFQISIYFSFAMGRFALPFSWSVVGSKVTAWLMLSSCLTSVYAGVACVVCLCWCLLVTLGMANKQLNDLNRIHLLFLPYCKTYSVYNRNCRLLSSSLDCGIQLLYVITLKTYCAHIRAC